MYNGHFFIVLRINLKHLMMFTHKSGKKILQNKTKIKTEKDIFLLKEFINLQILGCVPIKLIETVL